MSDFPIQTKTTSFLSLEETAPFLEVDDFSKSLVEAMLEVIGEIPFWDETIFERKLPGFYSGFLTCKTHECPYFAVCPIMSAIKKKYKHSTQQRQVAIDALFGEPCRLEVKEAAIWLANFVREHDVRPDSSSDILQILHIVKQTVLINRIDRELAVYGVAGESVVGVSAKGDAITDRRANEIIKHRALLEKSLQNALSQLVATRKDKANLAVQAGQFKMLSDLFARPKGVALKELRNSSKEDDPTNVVIDVEVT